MPKQEPVWEFSSEADALVKQICETYPEKFGHLDLNLIGCCAIANKEPPESQDWDCKISGVTEPELLFSKKTYVLHFFKCTWEKYEPKQRVLMLFRQLVRIPDEFDGSLLKEDLKDCRCLVKAFGLGYMDNPNVPNLLDVKQTNL